MTLTEKFVRRAITPGVLALAVGCGEGKPQADEVVPIGSVPSAVMETARKTLPGLKFDTAFKMKVNGKDAYEIRGKDKKGKTREVEVSATGEVLEIE
jgi:hypothetical protein